MKDEVGVTCSTQGRDETNAWQVLSIGQIPEETIFWKTYTAKWQN